MNGPHTLEAILWQRTVALVEGAVVEGHSGIVQVQSQLRNAQATQRTGSSTTQYPVVGIDCGTLSVLRCPIDTVVRE
jgi:hypothetical protein